MLGGFNSPKRRLKPYIGVKGTKLPRYLQCRLKSQMKVRLHIVYRHPSHKYACVCVVSLLSRCVPDSSVISTSFVLSLPTSPQSLSSRYACFTHGGTGLFDSSLTLRLAFRCCATILVTCSDTSMTCVRFSVSSLSVPEVQIMPRSFIVVAGL